MGTRDLEELMGLKHPIVIKELSTEDGGGIVASIPALGEDAFVADGSTIEEAIQNLQDVKRTLFQYYIEKGIEIPKPLSEDSFSGKFVVRLPKYLHRQLVEDAAANTVSLNNYCLSLLSRNQIAESYRQSLNVMMNTLQSMCIAIRQNIEFAAVPDTAFRGPARYFKKGKKYVTAA
jgi:predicted HicB family RNase H-like nuclease